MQTLFGSLVAAAPAKLNLTLRVIGQRSDGYHILDSLVVFAGLGDQLEAVDDSDIRLEITGPFAQDLPPSSANIVLRAAHQLAEATGQSKGARLRLVKQLPVAAGLGGGSADAAATLGLLARLWRLPGNFSLFDRIALSLGADVPVCLRGRPSRILGIGEQVTAAPRLPPAWLVLAKPRRGLVTAGVFRARQGPFSGPDDWPTAFADVEELAAALAGSGNDLQCAACQLCPEIESVLEALAATEGCLLARMSGSGSTCFGLYPDAGTAGVAARHLTVDHPDWWVQTAPMMRDVMSEWPSVEPRQGDRQCAEV